MDAGGIEADGAALPVGGAGGVSDLDFHAFDDDRHFHFGIGRLAASGAEGPEGFDFALGFDDGGRGGGGLGFGGAAGEGGEDPRCRGEDSGGEKAL